jgi:subtilisin family serine protease
VVGAVMNDHPRVRAKARQFQSVIHGFSAALTAQEAHDLAMDRRVVSVVEDPVISLVAPQSRSTVVGGSNDVWGLDRTNQRTLPLDDTFSATADGSGVYVYVVDAPIRITHSQFSARVLSGFSAPGINFLTGCDDHGTHVAGTVLGTTVGVAPGAQLIPVEVLDCNGDGLVSDVISGLEWIVSDIQANNRRPAVVNLSLGGRVFTDLDNAVRDLVAANITAVVAAGNESKDACNVSPARTQAAITVAASTITDAEASFSNYGSCVDLFAPGDEILSSWAFDDIDGTILSGTSMAAPHVAGVVALFLEQYPLATPAQVAEYLRVRATACAISYRVNRATQSPNRLLYVGESVGAPCPVRSVSASADDSKATVSWQEPEAFSGTTELTYTLTTSPTSLGCVTTALSCQLTGLTNGQQYSVFIVASNSSAARSSAATITLLPEGVPPATVINRVWTRSKTAIVRWDLLNFPYQTTYTARALGTNHSCSTTDNTCNIRKLVNGKRYRIVVTPSNYVGEGPVSEQTSIVVPGINVLRNTIPKKKKIAMSKFISTLSAGRKMYKVLRGGCQISSGSLVAPSQTGSCTLQLSVTASGAYPSMYNTAVIKVI